jgi:hypothetical protein
MAIEKFYDALNSNNYNKEELGRLVFRLEPNGPQFKVIPGDKYSDPRESIENNDYRVRMFFPGNHEITNPERKKEMLEQFFHNGRKI